MGRGAWDELVSKKLCQEGERAKSAGYKLLPGLSLSLSLPPSLPRLSPPPSDFPTINNALLQAACI